MPKSATLMLHGKIVDILDKGSGAVILADGTLHSFTIIPEANACGRCRYLKTKLIVFLHLYDV